jgi:hypothetical protein
MTKKVDVSNCNRSREIGFHNLLGAAKVSTFSKCRAKKMWIIKKLKFKKISSGLFDGFLNNKHKKLIFLKYKFID